MKEQPTHEYDRLGDRWSYRGRSIRVTCLGTFIGDGVGTTYYTFSDIVSAIDREEDKKSMIRVFDLKPGDKFEHGGKTLTKLVTPPEAQFGLACAAVTDDYHMVSLCAITMVKKLP